MLANKPHFFGQMKPVDNLHHIGEVFGRNPFNPAGPIGNRT
jgi:hypothetical protein